MQAEFLFLGTGASMGTPVVTCSCKVCKSSHRKNHRSRPSGVLKVQGQQILFDVGPDFRQQALTYGINRLDGVLITHGHYDHMGGMDDLRAFYFLQNQTLPCLLSRETFEEIRKRTPYFFYPLSDDVMGGPQLDFQVVEEGFTTVNFCGLLWQILPYEQSGMRVTGFRVGSFAYVMDLKRFSLELIEHLKGVKVLILSGLRERPSPAHLTLQEAIDFAQKTGAKTTWFSHVSHEMDHEETNRKLPSNMQLAYDGLTIEVSC